MRFFEKKPVAERVQALLAKGQALKAVELCRNTCAAATATSQDWLLYGCVSANGGDVVTAQAALEKAVQCEPELGEAHFELGKVYANTGQFPLALKHLRTASELLPDNPDVWLVLGISCGLANQFDDAEACCQRAVALNPDLSEARLNLANAMQAQGKLAEAELEYEAVLERCPDMENGWSMLAQARVGLKKFEEAETAAKQALALNPDMGEAHFMLGNIAAIQENHALAREHFQRAAEQLPEVSDVHMHLGQVLFDMSEFPDATECFHRVLGLSPECVEAHYLMGKCFEARRMMGRAENCYRKALALNKDYVQAHFALALMFVKQDRRDDAIARFTEILRIHPGDEQARHLLASQQGKTTDTAPVGYVTSLFDDFSDTFDDELVNRLEYRVPWDLHDIVKASGCSGHGSLDIIDLGCGTGLCATLFHPMARTLHGVDLSTRMIEKAGERGLYNSLEVGDIVDSLKKRDAAWDLVVSADLFIYVGNLKPVFSACGTALRPGGLFVFSVEAAAETETFILTQTGRYAHSLGYIRQLAKDNGFSEQEMRSVVLRKDKGQVDVKGYVFLLRREGEAP